MNFQSRHRVNRETYLRPTVLLSVLLPVESGLAHPDNLLGRTVDPPVDLKYGTPEWDLSKSTSYRDIPGQSDARTCEPSVRLSWPWIGAIAEVADRAVSPLLVTDRGVVPTLKSEGR